MMGRAVKVMRSGSFGRIRSGSVHRLLRLHVFTSAGETGGGGDNIAGQKIDLSIISVTGL